MTIQELINQIRYQVNDIDKIEYTDSELIEYINQAQDYVSQIAINHRFKGLINQSDLSLSDGKATLPTDFVKEYKVKAGGKLLKSVSVSEDVDIYSYKIIGNEIYSGNEKIILYYFHLYPTYTAATDTIQIPRIFENLLREMVVYLALNRTDINVSFEIQLSRLYESKVLNIISSYGNGNLERPMPFRI